MIMHATVDVFRVGLSEAMRLMSPEMVFLARGSRSCGGLAHGGSGMNLLMIYSSSQNRDLVLGHTLSMAAGSGDRVAEFRVLSSDVDGGAGGNNFWFTVGVVTAPEREEVLMASEDSTTLNLFLVRVLSSGSLLLRIENETEHALSHVGCLQL
ncbi:hypothetical protein NE237_029607 [Protea cynaroides]|uniref:Uncharacterized protein n=1 Tax=Protea cynaroides TaxID=273540 RepID=A0A9Q0JW83_9MAGN|nr:hypothetical protein NE237_029607 [Protea cynaroides]